MASWGVKAGSPRLSALVKTAGSQQRRSRETEGDGLSEGSGDSDSLEEEEEL